ncbi:hypothetical protein D4Q71_20535 [Rhodopseudomonas palustris]|nr:hypothetical protein D4Q71_20535 [Rhodopseudomonas palustris]
MVAQSLMRSRLSLVHLILLSKVFLLTLPKSPQLARWTLSHSMPSSPIGFASLNRNRERT